MAWADWLVPKLTLSAEAQLHSNIDVIRRNGANNVDELMRLTIALTQQNALQQAIIRQAISHIGELEMREALQDRRASFGKRVLRWIGR